MKGKRFLVAVLVAVTLAGSVGVGLLMRPASTEATVVPAVPPDGLPLHMNIVGVNQGHIQGECQTAGREGSILVESFSLGTNFTKTSSVGETAGNRVHDPLTVVSVIGSQSPKLFKALITGEVLNVEIKWFRATGIGGEEHYLTTRLENALISSYNVFLKQEPVQSLIIPSQFQVDGFNGLTNFGHMEEISFVYQKITWIYEPTGEAVEDAWKVSNP
jgi:type VI secretion system secreted protein Hcp